MSTIRHQTRQKRGGGQVLGESASWGRRGIDEGIARFLSREPSPVEAAQFADDYERLLEMLSNPTLRTIAMHRLEGHTSEEIAAISASRPGPSTASSS